jgi:hypothetical protein
MTLLILNAGQWENGRRHGEGIFTYPNKDVYSGWWAFGKKQGKGTYVFADTGMRVSNPFSYYLKLLAHRRLGRKQIRQREMGASERNRL